MPGETGRSEVRRRLTLVAVALTACGLVLTGQLVRWQLLQGRVLAERATGEYMRYETIDPRRGTIYSADGRILATDVYTYSLTAAPHMIRDPYLLADRLFPLVGLSRDALASRLDGDGVWQPLADGIALSVADEIAKWKEPGLFLEPHLSRAYPDASLVEPLLGFVNRARDGYYGVEGYYDALLRGQPGARLGDFDGFGQEAPFGRRVMEPPADGADLYLTVDSRVQYVLWRELRDALGRYQAASGTIIAMDPRTGAILGAVSLPAYDPTAYESADVKLYEDPAISHEWEPGSVFKVITMAAGLDSGLITPDTVFEDTGSFEIAGVTIKNWDREAHGPVTMTEVLGLSLNTGASYVSTLLGPDRFYAYLAAFGFGERLGVDLQAEARGSTKRPGDGRWYEADLATNSFGQGIAVTPLQMLSAVAAIANDGLLMQPHVVGQTVTREGLRQAQPTPVRRVISSETARTLTEMMVAAVDEETIGPRLEGFEVAGKTGTAQIPIPGGYHPSDIIASFVGFFPASDPQLCILVKIDRPQAGQWGSEVAAPVFSRVAGDLAVLLGIEPESGSSGRMASR
ncbi:MAG: penicillin-binding protein 2 [Anaerolineae bacterium]|nr:penicillin-binding protein 2 [Anaerolineae bacterium]